MLEYAAPVLCSFQVKDIVSLERVQRRVSRLAQGQKRGEMDYEERCSIFKWSPLKNRRLYFSLIECYNCIFSLSNLEFQDFFQLASKRTRSNHNYKLKFQASSCNCYKYSFFVRIVRVERFTCVGCRGGKSSMFQAFFRIIFKYLVAFSLYFLNIDFIFSYLFERTFLTLHFNIRIFLRFLFGEFFT